MANLIITIDGPAASGKSTAARLLAKELGASFLDTGAMYRAVTLAAMQAKVDMGDEDKLLDVIQTSDFQFTVRDDKMVVYRYIASSPKARGKLVEMQRRFATERQNIVTEGRDQGTVAFCDADVKFYLTADSAERARRRQADLQAQGNNESLEQIQKAIEERDKSDENRTIGPLRPAEDAIVVDTTGLGIEEVVEKLLDYVKEGPHFAK